MPPLVSAVQLTKKYGDLVAVDGIDFEILEGECFGFLGPNGAGKTTTVRMIHCVSPLTSGTLTVAGHPAAIDNRALKQITGVIPQEINLDNDLTVFENLVVFARFFDIGRREAKTRISELLRFVELEAKAESKISDLSTGMKRRLLIARALINRPRVIVADEPTTGLDPQARHLIWQRLRQLKSQGDDAHPDDPVHGGGPAALRPAGRHVPGQDPQGGDAVASRRGGDRPGGRRDPDASRGRRPDPQRAQRFLLRP